MSRYIDAERFKLWLQENYVLYDGDRYFNDIDAQPTADVVEVVRCKFCKKSGMCDLEDRGRLYDDNFYCAEGDKDDE